MLRDFEVFPCDLDSVFCSSDNSELISFSKTFLFNRIKKEMYSYENYLALFYVYVEGN
jgi:hypothetical protein